jgi:hypothetical protein
MDRSWNGYHSFAFLIGFQSIFVLKVWTQTANLFQLIVNDYIILNGLVVHEVSGAGSSVVVMFDSQSKGRGFKSRPVHPILC